MLFITRFITIVVFYLLVRIINASHELYQRYFLFVSEYEFPSVFDALERAYLHHKAKEFGLKSKSRGYDFVITSWCHYDKS